MTWRTNDDIISKINRHCGDHISHDFSLSTQAAEADKFKGLTAEQALEKSHQYHRTGTASVQVMPDVLVAKFKDGSQIQIPTHDQHLLSIAPYEFRTHPCGYHVPTGCQGEMVEKV